MTDDRSSMISRGSEQNSPECEWRYELERPDEIWSPSEIGGLAERIRALRDVEDEPICDNPQLRLPENDLPSHIPLSCHCQMSSFFPRVKLPLPAPDQTLVSLFSDPGRSFLSSHSI